MKCVKEGAVYDQCAYVLTLNCKEAPGAQPPWQETVCWECWGALCSLLPGPSVLNCWEVAHRRILPATSRTIYYLHQACCMAGQPAWLLQRPWFSYNYIYIHKKFSVRRIVVSFRSCLIVISSKAGVCKLQCVCSLLLLNVASCFIYLVSCITKKYGERGMQWHECILCILCAERRQGRGRAGGMHHCWLQCYWIADTSGLGSEIFRQQSDLLPGIFE